VAFATDHSVELGDRLLVPLTLYMLGQFTVTGAASDSRVLGTLLECLDLVMALVALFSAFLAGFAVCLPAAAVSDRSDSKTVIPMVAAANISFFSSMANLLSVSKG